MTRKQKNQLIRIATSGVLFALLLPLHFTDVLPTSLELPLFLAVYLLIGWDIVADALGNIRRGQIFDENLLMTVASIGAFCLGEFPEGVAVMLFYQVGEWFQDRAVAKSRSSIAALMDIRPEFANLLREGQLTEVDPEDVQPGDVIVVRPGERIPLDGVVLEGTSNVETSALTGEAMPRPVAPGEEVISGCINQSGRLTIRVSKAYDQSTVAKILELVETASDKKSKSEAFITRFARVYTPMVFFAALVLSVVPPLVLGQGFAMWIQRGLTFLVVSCPCALVISVPLSFFGGIGGASRAGVLVKGSNYLEALSNTDTIIFDKTGTLTQGEFAVNGIHPEHISREALLELAAYTEAHSTHPIAQSIQKAYAKPVDFSRIQAIQEIPGHGLQVEIDGKTLLAGNARLLDQQQISHPQAAPDGTAVYLAEDGRYIGHLIIQDQVKADAPAAIAALKNAGIKTVMLTGDTEAVGRQVAAQLGLDEVHTQLLPADKVTQLERILASKRRKSNVVYVGDGINDAPVLARSDIGIAMGGLGSDAAIEAADVVIMTDEPSKLPTILDISKKTLAIVRQNIALALGIKAVVLLLSALGRASMWAAVFADVGVSMIAILNAMRALNGGRDVGALPQTPPGK